MKTATWKSHDLLLGSGFTYQVFFSSAVESPLRLGCIIIMIFTYYLYIYIYIHASLLIYFEYIVATFCKDRYSKGFIIFLFAIAHCMLLPHITLYIFISIPWYSIIRVIYHHLLFNNRIYGILLYVGFFMTFCDYNMFTLFCSSSFTGCVYIYIQIYTNIHSVIIYCIIFWARHHHMMLLCLRLFCFAILCFAMILHLHCI